MTEPTKKSFSRRQLMTTGAVAGGALLASHLSQPKVEAAKPSALKKGSVVLFQGDSITDAGRNRGSKGANSARAMGFGYPFLISSALLADHPQSEIKCYNRGISGNKVPDLDKRWDEDCIKLKPDVLSILIGVNDIWHKLNGRYDGTVKDYEVGFAALLERTKKALPNTRIVICEPFVLRCGAVKDNWFPEFEERRAAAERVSKAAKATWVPFQAVLNEAVKTTAPNYWAGDGVHPSMAGHALMAKTWREAVDA